MSNLKNVVFSSNNIIEEVYTGDIERIVWIDYVNMYCFTINMDTTKFRINKREIKDLEEKVANKIIKKHLDTKHIMRTDKTMSSSEKERMEYAKKVIDFIFKNCKEPYIYDRNLRGKIVKKTVEKFKVEKKTIYKYLRKYLQGGKTLFSLLPDYYNCGGRNKFKRLGDKKIGRPSYRSEVCNQGINVDDKIKKIFLRVINKYYQNKKKTPLSEVYRIMIQEYYSYIVIEDGKEIKRPLPYYKIPNLSQFRYWCKNLVDIVKIIKDRESRADYMNNYRGLPSNTVYESFGSNFRAQIDSTICSVEILNRMRNGNIGTPTVYHVIDEFSTLIMGISVNVRRSSWDGASSAILNCVEDKVKYCEKYGLTITEDEWPTTKLPRILITDRGPEFSGNLPNYTVQNLNIVLQNTPTKLASYKGNVEQSFNTSEVKMRTWIPGMTPKGGRRRGDKDPKEYAKLNIEDITYVYLTLAVHHNNRVISDHPYAGKLMKEGIIPTPVNLYNWGMKKLSSGLADYDIDFIKLNLLRRGTATVDKRGIKFGKYYYETDRALKENWHTKARIKGSWHVDICYDYRNMDTIYIINEGDTHYDICTIKDEFGFYKGRTLDEIEDYEEYKTANKRSIYTDYNNQNDLDKNERLKSMVNNIEKMPGGKGKNSSIMKKDISEKRRIENIIYSKDQAITLSEKGNSSTDKYNNFEEKYTTKNVVYNRLNSLREEKK